MKSRSLVLFLILAMLCPAAVSAQFTVKTRLAMARDAMHAMVGKEEQQLRCFVEVTSADDLARLKAAGVTIDARFGTLATVRMPRHLLPTMASMVGVRRVALAQTMVLTNDSARIEGHVDPVHMGENLPQAFRGRGVVIGIIDTGIDFNHINFLDAQGRNRISRVYMPQDSTGQSPVVDGDTLPGSHYTTPEQIAALISDTPNHWHGTHTLGTAAGSYTGNGYYGVAPEADLVACGMPLLYDTDIANAIRYILDYADSVHRPAVVSMSFASQEGAHNGTSPLCQVFDSVSGPGRIMVISAGNDARLRVYLSHRFKTVATDTLRTYFDNYYSSSSYKGYMSAWSETQVRHRVGFTVIDRSTSQQIAATPLLPAVDSLFTVPIDSIAELAPYFTGEVAYGAALEDNGQYHSILEMNVVPMSANYRLGMQIVADEPVLLRAWSSGVIMINDAKVPGYTAAVRNSCINDLATGDQAISVGAYCSRATVPMADGSVQTVDRSVPGDIAYFSSYGPDARGVQRPDICAPGLALVSSGSRHVSNWSEACDIVNIDGEQYPYFLQGGTSMSTPFTAGAIALWLQACPTLTSDDVRQVLNATSRRDNYVDAAPARWGYGKLDVAAGLNKVLTLYHAGDLNGDGLVDVDDLNVLINVILGKVTTIPTADINHSGMVDIDDVNALINLILH